MQNGQYSDSLPARHELELDTSTCDGMELPSPCFGQVSPAVVSGNYTEKQKVI